MKDDLETFVEHSTHDIDGQEFATGGFIPNDQTYIVGERCCGCHIIYRFRSDNHNSNRINEMWQHEQTMIQAHNKEQDELFNKHWNECLDMFRADECTPEYYPEATEKAHHVIATIFHSTNLFLYPHVEWITESNLYTTEVMQSIIDDGLRQGESIRKRLEMQSSTAI